MGCSGRQARTCHQRNCVNTLRRALARKASGAPDLLHSLWVFSDAGSPIPGRLLRGRNMQAPQDTRWRQFGRTTLSEELQGSMLAVPAQKKLTRRSADMTSSLCAFLVDAYCQTNICPRLCNSAAKTSSGVPRPIPARVFRGRPTTTSSSTVTTLNNETAGSSA
jgi:hypothetical protein